MEKYTGSCGDRREIRDERPSEAISTTIAKRSERGIELLE
jgi:hypothetical protein